MKRLVKYMCATQNIKVRITTHSTPHNSKQQQNSFMMTTAPPLEDDLPTGVRLEDILPKWYDTLCSDHPWVHKVRCSLLGLEVGTMPSREDIDSTERFIP